jgi:DNA-binding response OmpR family regulator
LRQELADDPSRPKWITTEPGLGYRWLRNAE